MRVALISFGFADYCLALANGLAGRADVALIMPVRESDGIRERLDSAVELMPVRQPRLRQPARQARMCTDVCRQVRRFSPDVVHLQQGHLWLNLALPLLRSWPLVVTIHDHTPHPGDLASLKTPQAVMNLAFKRADQVIVHAERLKREAIALRGLAPETVHVIPHVALGEGLPEPMDVVRTVPGDHEQRDVLFFGRIWPYKGLEYLIRAEPVISAAVADARFIIAGQGEDLARYRRLMSDPERFEVYNEFVSVDRRTELFNRAALVVLPYIEASQSGVAHLAYSFGKPVVASSVGGLPDIVEHGRTGLLVPPADVHELAEAIITLLRSADLRRALGRAGYAKLQRECSPARIAALAVEVYTQALSGHHPSASPAARTAS